MNIDMDEELREYQTHKIKESRPSLMQWLFIITLGVFLGNIASFGVEKAVLYMELKAVSLAMKESTIKMNKTIERREAKLASQRKVQEENAFEQKRTLALQNRQHQIKQEQKQAAFRQANETCNFWKQQVRTENTEQNRLYKEASL